MADLKRAMAHISVKSHANAALNPKAHLRNKITDDDVLNAMTIAAPLGLFDCSGVSDGAACAIVTTPEIARALKARRRDRSRSRRSRSRSATARRRASSGWDGAHVATARVAARAPTRAAGITDPRAPDRRWPRCTTASRSPRRCRWKTSASARPGASIHDVLDGVFDLDGKLPIEPDGGLKCFGHPIGASGLRMVYEVYQQLHGRAGERQLQTGRPRPDARTSAAIRTRTSAPWPSSGATAPERDLSSFPFDRRLYPMRGLKGQDRHRRPAPAAASAAPSRCAWQPKA